MPLIASLSQFLSRRLKCRSLLILCLSFSLLATAAPSARAIPQGVFSLGISGQTIPDALLADPDIIGFSIRYSWADLEPAEGSFSWAFLDSELARVAGAGKQVLL